MRHRNTLFLIAFLSSCILMKADLVAAEHSNWREDYLAKQEALLEEVFQELNLTQEQQDRINENRNAQKDLRNAIKEKTKAKRSELRLELEKENATKESIDAIADELINLIKQRMRARVDGVWTVKQILSPEQFKMLQQKKQQFQEDHQKHEH